MAENTKFGRRPCQVVTVEQDFCNLTYGELPCQATLDENLYQYSENMDDPDGYWSVVGGTAGYVLQLVTNGGIVLGNMAPFDPSVGCRLEQGTARVGIPRDKTYTVSFVFEKTNDALVPGDEDGVLNLQAFLSDAGSGPDSGLAAVIQYAFNPATGATIGTDATNSTLIDFGYETVEPGIGRAFITFDYSLDWEEPQAFSRFELSADRDSVRMGAFSLREGPDDGEYLKTTNQPRPRTGTDKCFNTRSTCQDPANYDRGVLPLRFVENRTDIPTDDYYIPSLQSVRVTPARLNPGGANRSASALGERATIALQFQDHTHDDRQVDKYRTERAYNPSEQGTFWTKWRARNPYYMQRPLFLDSGYILGGQLVDTVTRGFVITGFTGPDAQGRVTITGKDVLTMAENDKAQAPFVSSGKLDADISAGAGSLVVSPSGVGAEYPASGEIRVGKEVMTFTRSGDNFTITRGQFGTDADDHKEGDSVQLCLRYVSQSPQDILFDLLNTYAQIPASYLDKAQWDAEALEFLPRLYTAIITEPEGVSKLISEMCQQMYFAIWFDERVGKVLLKSVRLAQGEQITELDDNAHLIQDSVQWRDLSDQLVTQVWVYYGQIDPTEKLDQADNYAAVEITADLLAEGADKHNLRRIKKVFSRWIDATNASAAIDLGQRILNRYGNAPRECTFRVDAKDGALWLADYIRLTNRNRVDIFGNPSPVNLQIFQAQEAVTGTEFQYTAQEFIPALTDGDDVEDPDIRTIPLTVDLLNVNLRTLHDAQFGPPAGTETITFVIRSGVVIGGDAAGGGVNVQLGQRVTVNDTYAAGNSQVRGLDVGELHILQRQGITGSRTINGGAAYPGLGTADAKVIEYEASTALDTGDWPAGVTLNLVIEGGAQLLGEGGNGSMHAIVEHLASPSFNNKTVAGGDGGHALFVRRAISITNGGTIGGGGGGGAAMAQLDPSLYLGIGGGGGAGREISDAVTKSEASGGGGAILSNPSSHQRNPAFGSETAGGLGGQLVTGFRGGRGGDLAANGQQALTTSQGQQFFHGAVGVAGKAVSGGASLITWVNKGDVVGDEVA